MSQQKAALLLAKHGKIEVGARPIPSPQGKQALVKITAAARTFQQYALVDSEAMAKTPENISDDQASTIPAAAATALMAIFQKSGVAFPEEGPTTSEKPILVLGGSSSVGQYAIQLARIADFSPIITTASSAHTSLLEPLGATHALDHNADAHSVQVVSSIPVSFVVDTISVASTQILALDVFDLAGS
ncbi:hypothetical protein FRC07_008929, partial [Ceratobasidium sp. 392]